MRDRVRHAERREQARAKARYGHRVDNDGLRHVQRVLAARSQRGEPRADRAPSPLVTVRAPIIHTEDTRMNPIAPVMQDAALAARGMVLMDVDWRNGSYVAIAQNARGSRLEAIGRTPELALANLARLAVRK